jgi:hypothetical protein
MNYGIFTVKVIQNSGQSLFQDGTALTELIVQLPQVIENKPKFILQLSIWGKLSYDVIKYCQPNDYLIIEGHISIKNSTKHNFNKLSDKQVEVTVFKLYPFLSKL